MLHVLSTVNVNHSQIIVCTKASFYCPKENTKKKKKRANTAPKTDSSPQNNLFRAYFLEICVTALDGGNIHCTATRACCICIAAYRSVFRWYARSILIWYFWVSFCKQTFFFSVQIAKIYFHRKHHTHADHFFHLVSVAHCRKYDALDSPEIQVLNGT